MPSTFQDFTSGGISNIQSDDWIVGYDTATLGGERRWTISTISNTVSGIIAPSIIQNINTSGLSGTEIVYITEKKATPTIAANTLTLNLSTASLFYVNLNAAINTFTLTNVPASPKVFSFTLQFVADGNARTVTWPTGTRWSGGTNPTLTSTLNKVDTFNFLTHDGGSNWFAYTSDQNQ